MSLPLRVLEYCRAHSLVRKDSHLAVAVSGGLDSVVLLDVLLEIRRALEARLVVASVDHGLRGRESAFDASFVRRLAAERGLPCYCGRFQALAGRGVEEAARRERAAFLRGVPADAVALAHHRDDQAETVLLRLLRSSSLEGLAAMSPRRGRLVRPLLGIPRQDLRAWAEVRGLSWREDASNRELDRERNRVRARVLPLLEEVHGGATERLAALADAVGTEGQVLQRCTERAWGRAWQDGCVSRPGLSQMDRGDRLRVLRELVRSTLGHDPGLSRKTLLRAARLTTDGREGAWIPLPRGWRFAVDGMRGMCLPPPPPPLLLRLSGVRRWGVHTISLERFGPGRQPVLLRAPLPGERMAKRSLRRLLSRLGVSAPLREYHPVFCTRERVLWVAGASPPRENGGPGDLAITVTASIPTLVDPGRPWSATL